jgi:hypothetical protein
MQAVQCISPVTVQMVQELESLLLAALVQLPKVVTSM